MHQLGVKIHLHCFEYGRGKQPELDKYCEEVFYYGRKKIPGVFSLRLPYIVSSRINPLMIKNILKDNYPVLLEGIHCTYYLYHGELNNRKVLVRLHNVEHQYYHQLAKATTNFYKKIYFLFESILLKKYENTISKKAKFLVVNKKDKETYENKFSAKDVEFLPAFLPFNQVQSQAGKGTFCLYHGNLSVVENEKVVFWLLNIFNDLGIDLIIAGKNPSLFLKRKINENTKARLFENPSTEKMTELIKNAHIHILPSFNNTGIKIKLLNALFNGRFIITNGAALEGTGFETLCEVAESPSDFKKIITQLLPLPFTEAQIKKRSSVLNGLYNNEKNAMQLINWL
ncbi:MAG: glycosyltransferase [Bacteroidota bacterium]|nr:glycosyltransferase [Bacteroidota bacterium]